jgi:uncharacterized protein (DUF885 family)
MTDLMTQMLDDQSELIESLRQQLAELEDDEQKAVERCVIAEQKLAEAVKMLSEQDYEYNRKTNAIIERHSQQLAEANNQVNQLNGMMRDKGFGQGEIDMMGWYEQQLAECQARVKQLEDQLEGMK